MRQCDWLVAEQARLRFVPKGDWNGTAGWALCDGRRNDERSSRFVNDHNDANNNQCMNRKRASARVRICYAVTDHIPCCLARWTVNGNVDWTMSSRQWSHGNRDQLDSQGKSRRLQRPLDVQQANRAHPLMTPQLFFFRVGQETFVRSSGPGSRTHGARATKNIPQ
jgi:hypothetical protein